MFDEDTQWLDLDDGGLDDRTSIAGVGLIVALPLLAAGTSLLFGLAVGGLGGYMLAHPAPATSNAACADSREAARLQEVAPTADVEEAREALGRVVVELTSTLEERGVLGRVWPG